jgi:hypothetical protein
MLAAAAAELALGVDAEQKSLEDVTPPLSLAPHEAPRKETLSA